MKRILVIASCVLLLASCGKQVYLFSSFHEPADRGLRMLYSYDGFHWSDLDTVLLAPKVGQQQVMRDPSIVRGPDGTFHLVWTSSWRGDKGFGYASSKDLIHWSAERFIPVMENEPTTVNVWAPELFYDDEKKEYIIVWASCIPGRFARGIEEDSNNHRLYYTTTRDFNSFTPSKLFLDPGFSVIDAVIVKRKPGDYVLVLKDNTRNERDIKVAFGKQPTGPFGPASAAFTESFTEGPSVLHLGKDWYIFYDSYRKKTYEVMQTRDFISFSNATGKFTIPSGHKHGTVFKAPAHVLRKLKKQYQKK